jgi:cytochrome c-type biogenesis protein CcmF
MMGVLLLFMPLAQAGTWRKADLKPLMKLFLPAAIAAVVVAVAVTVLWGKTFWLVPGLLVGLWVVFGVGTDLARRVGPGGFGRLLRLPIGVWGMAIAHIGVGLFTIGATCEAAGRSQQTFPLAQGEQAVSGGWTFRFNGVEEVEGPNYYATRANIAVTHDGRTEMIYPEKRFYPVAGTPTTEVAIRKSLTGDVYVALGDTIRGQPGVWRIQIGHHPLMDWIWAGCGLIAVGGFMSLASRIRRSAKIPAEETETVAAPGTAAKPAGASA